MLGVAYYAGMLDDAYRAQHVRSCAELNRRARRRAAGATQTTCGGCPKSCGSIETAGVDLIGQVPLSRLVDHIEHAATVAGIDHVGIGCDYDAVGLRVPEGLEHIGLTPNLTAALAARGFSDDDINKVMGANVLRAMQQAESA